MYFCKNCGKYFSKQKTRNNVLIWDDYSQGKQTQEQIAKKIGKSREWVNRTLKKGIKYSEKNSQIKPQETVLVVDTTYFKQFGLMVFRSSTLKENLFWKIVKHETNEEYQTGIQTLINSGWNIQALVADGKPGLSRLFPDIPFQLCQFHQFQTVTRYISKNPKLEASRELRSIMFNLKQTTQLSFEYWLDEWHEKWKTFLVEKTINPLTGNFSFTHRRLRAAYFGLRRNLDILFTFERYLDQFDIPNTTNSLDGYFSHLKSKLSVHRGASKNTQINLISELIFL